MKKAVAVLLVAVVALEIGLTLDRYSESSERASIQKKIVSEHGTVEHTERLYGFRNPLSFSGHGRYIYEVGYKENGKEYTGWVGFRIWSLYPTWDLPTDK